MYYKICDNCGAWLDVGEQCDCDGSPQPITGKDEKAGAAARRHIRKAANEEGFTRRLVYER